MVESFRINAVLQLHQPLPVILQHKLHLLARRFILANLLYISVVFRPILLLLSPRDEVEVTFVQRANLPQFLNSRSDRLQVTCLVGLGAVLPLFEKPLNRLH